MAVEIVVADTGCGIVPERLGSIFREFEQVEQMEPRSSSGGGVGLGLAVVARIVEQCVLQSISSRAFLLIRRCTDSEASFVLNRK